MEAKSSQDLQGAITATQKLWRRYHLSYDQTQYVVKEVRRALTLERPTSQRLTGLLRDLFENQLRLALRVRYGDGTHNPLSHGIHTCETLSQKNPLCQENAHRACLASGRPLWASEAAVSRVLIPTWLPFIMPTMRLTVLWILAMTWVLLKLGCEHRPLPCDSHAVDMHGRDPVTTRSVCYASNPYSAAPLYRA